MPESPLSALEFADWMALEVVAESAGAKAGRRRKEPVEDESRLWHDLTLQLPQSRVAVVKHRRRRAETDARAHNRIGKFARRIAVASKGDAMLRSIDIEHLARQHFEIPFGATMLAAQTASIKADHDCRSHCVNVGIRHFLGTQSRDMLATRRVRLRTVPALSAPPTGATRRHLCKRRERGVFGGDVGERQDPSWLENIRYRIKKTIKRENIDLHILTFNGFPSRFGRRDERSRIGARRLFALAGSSHLEQR